MQRVLKRSDATVRRKRESSVGGDDVDLLLQFPGRCRRHRRSESNFPRRKRHLAKKKKKREAGPRTSAVPRTDGVALTNVAGYGHHRFYFSRRKTYIDALRPLTV